MIERRIMEQGLVADFFVPEGKSKRPTIILLGGSEGGKSWSRIRQVVTRLSERGCNLLSAAYFKGPGLPETLEEIPLEMFDEIISWLAAQPEVIPDHYAIIGGSKGAELGLLLASRYPQIRAVVAISPSSVVWQGIPKQRFQLGNSEKSSWSEDGIGIPFVPYLLTGKDRLSLVSLRLRKIHERALLETDRDRLNEASIPLEKANAAIMLVSGEKDQMWPAAVMGEQIIARLREHQYPLPFVHQRYKSGHNGLIINREMWREVFGFLDENFLARQ